MAMKRRAEAYWLEKTKRWQINVQKQGERKTFNSSTPGKKGKHECEEKADKWLVRFESEQRFEDAFACFMEDKRETTSETTYKQYESVARNYLFPAISAKKHLSDISPWHWQKILDSACAEGKSENTIKMIKGLIVDFVSFCLRRKYAINRLEAGELQIRNAKAAKEKSAYDADEIKRLLSPELDECWEINAFRFMLFTGIRRGEALALRWSDIDAEKSVFRVNGSLSKYNQITCGKTSNAIRNNALNEKAKTILDTQQKKLADNNVISEFVFPDKNGKIMQYARLLAIWTVISKKHGFAHTIHELRHTYISLADKELPLALLKKSVGHSASMSTQKTYSHTTQADIEAIKAGVEKAFSDIV